MEEIGIDIINQAPKRIEEKKKQSVFAFILTISGDI